MTQQLKDGTKCGKRGQCNELGGSINAVYNYIQLDLVWLAKD
jgi:hypothetical protein